MFRSRVASLRALACVCLAFSAAGILVLGGAQPSSSSREDPLSPATQAQLQRAALEGLPKTGAPGMSVAVTSAGAGWGVGVGLADLEHDIPVTADTVFRIASITKPITATAVMQLVERGLVSLDDPIQKYVPAFPPKGEHLISVRHLLTHTSGIRHYKPGEFNHKEAYDSVDAALGIFKDDPLLFAPGTKYSYSTYGYNLLAGVVERASGLAFETYLVQHVFGPAGMTRTYLEQPEQIVPRRGRQYVRAGGGRFLNAPYADLSVKWAGGGIISTAGDLTKFDAALAAGRLLRPATQEIMYSPMTLADGSASTYALGWMISREPDGRRSIAHSGGATGGTTYLLRRPDCRIAVALLTNVQDAPGLRELAMEFAGQVPCRPM